jgi:hypothetical protein
MGFDLSMGTASGSEDQSIIAATEKSNLPKSGYMFRPKDQVELHKKTCGECKVTVVNVCFPKLAQFTQINRYREPSTSS